MKTLEEFASLPRSELFEIVDTLKRLRDNFTHDCCELGLSGLQMLAYEARLKSQLKLAQLALSRKFRRKKAAGTLVGVVTGRETEHEQISIDAARIAVHKTAVLFRPANAEFALVEREVSGRNNGKRADNHPSEASGE